MILMPAAEIAFYIFRLKPETGWLSVSVFFPQCFIIVLNISSHETAGPFWYGLLPSVHDVIPEQINH